MTINKNNANYNNENGKKVRGAGRRYAAFAAAFALLAGGVCGAAVLGKNMNETADRSAAAAVDAIVETTTIEAAAQTTIEAFIAPADDSRVPEDLDAFAKEWIDNYNVWLKIPNGAVEREEDTVAFKLAEGSVVDKIDAWKITDEEYRSADAINERLRAFWAPGCKDDIDIPDLTEKIDNGTAEYADFTNGIYFVYNDELYRTVGNSGVYGTRNFTSAEKISDDEILVNWELGWEGVTVPQTMRLVWVDELDDWRAADIVDESEYFAE